MWPKAILLQPSLIATEFIMPLRRFAHNEHGFFSFRMSKTISLIWDFSSINGTPILLQVSFKKSELKPVKQFIYKHRKQITKMYIDMIEKGKTPKAIK